MRAVRLTPDGIELHDDVPDPVAGPGQAVVEVLAAGLCHSDLTVAARPEHPFALPVTLGHELAGRVVALGPGAAGPAVGDLVAGYGPRGCGTCRSCFRGDVNVCRRRPVGLFPPGLGADGALAERVVVDAASLVPADGLDPAVAAALTDAGLTAQHAVRRLDVAAGDLVVVIGVGGLGHLAVQLARLRGCRVVAIDVVEAKLELALRAGAERAVLPDDAEQAVAELAVGGADAVVDLVASESTLAAAARLVGAGGVVSIVGVGSARLPVGMHAVPLGTRVDVPFWGSRGDLVDVLELGRRGLLEVETEAVGFDDVVATYDRLDRGDVLGRAVLVPR